MHFVQNSLNQVKNYCENFFLWQRLIHKFANIPRIELMNWNEIEDGKSHFENLTLPIAATKIRDLTRVWETLCCINIKDPSASPMGKFIQALYESCEG